jgi:anthranilate synthase/indole-3-glycerol phosphate synthase/phosphoribosylanthranilate isomerase
MSEGGRPMMANFLKFKGGKWGGENAWCGVPGDGEDVKPKVNGANGHSPSLPTILNQIQAQRLLDVQTASASPSSTPANLLTSLSLHTAPPLINFLDRLNSTPHTAVMAEIKRASPSKGDIASLTSAPAQALRYALAGASVISVLTEPKWFKGSLTDMLLVRQALDSLPNRPAILRKDFILSTYQIDEARLHGADTVLLIIAMLEPDLLRELYLYSISLGMEPLVEVNNPTELSLALDIGAKVIGVNNRNLHDFNVDMSTTSRVNAALDGRDVILCALSGISSPSDVEKYVAEGVRAVLVGESLMRAEEPTQFLRSLIGLPKPEPTARAKPMVKICGIQSLADAEMAIATGADLLGIILVPGANRRIEYTTAREISNLVRSTRSKRPSSSSTIPTINKSITTPTSISAETSTLPWFTHHSSQFQTRRKPLLVGVFQNQPLSEILEAVDEIGLDLVQLHGNEPQSWAHFIPVPFIKCFRVSPDGSVRGGEINRPGLNQYILLDAASTSASAKGGGGEGKSFPWVHARDVVVKGEVGTEGRFPLPVILAGGLNPGNVAQAIEEAGAGVFCVDVSSGVEKVGGGKEWEKVEEFIRAAKGA